MGTRARCQHGTVGAAGEAPQTADGAVAVVSTEYLKQVRHDEELFVTGPEPRPGSEFHLFPAVDLVCSKSARGGPNSSEVRLN